MNSKISCTKNKHTKKFSRLCSRRRAWTSLPLNKIPGSVHVIDHSTGHPMSDGTIMFVPGPKCPLTIEALTGVGVGLGVHGLLK